MHTQVSEWVRRLVEDGDIERQPGPHRCFLTYACVNTAGVKGCWTLLREAASRFDVLLMQETGFRDEEEEAAFRRFAFKQGFRFWNTRGHSTAGKGYRGVGILVRKGLRASFLQSWRHREEQVLAIQVEGIAFLSLYASVNGGNAEVEDQMVQWLASRESSSPWALFGDHNAIPAHNPLVDLLTRGSSGLVVVMDEQGRAFPTRLGGKKCIDYGITSGVSLQEPCCFDDCVIADHKILYFRLSLGFRGNNNGHAILARTSELLKPDQVSQEIWLSTLSASWTSQGSFEVPDSASQETLNEVWEGFCQRLEVTLKRAIRVVASSFPQPDEQSPAVFAARRPDRGEKNSWKFQRTQVFPGTSKAPQSSFRERALQKVIFRLSETAIGSAKTTGMACGQGQ